MVCIRCKMIVKTELDKLGIFHGVVNLGDTEIRKGTSTEQLLKLKLVLLKYGLELMQDKNAILIEKIKNIVIELVHYVDESPKIKKSEYISEKLNYDYTYLANIFSEATGTTIEQFIIVHKIERVKELLINDELTLSEISYKLNYSSVAHLSNQFKKITGITATIFKALKNKKRNNLEDVGNV